jgi:hypothetical protein
MDSMTEVAVRLARKGASDDVIALVMETMAPRARAAAVPQGVTPPLPLNDQQHRAASVSRPPGRVRRYYPLLAAIRQHIVASGPVEASARTLCDQHRAEWMQSREGLTSHENARGLGAVVAHALKHTDGVVGGLRFTFVRVDRGSHLRSGSGVAVYRVEAA